jgi:hypothetical protein
VRTAGFSGGTARDASRNHLSTRILGHRARKSIAHGIEEGACSSHGEAKLGRAFDLREWSGDPSRAFLVADGRRERLAHTFNDATREEAAA